MFVFSIVSQIPCYVMSFSDLAYSSTVLWILDIPMLPY